MSSTSNYRDLLKQRDALDQQIEEAFQEERRGAIRQCIALIQEFDLTAFDVKLSKVKTIPGNTPQRSERTWAAKVPQRTVTPVYQNPENGQTWTGRGKQPRWITGPREDYLIGNSRERAGPNQATAARAA